MAWDKEQYAVELAARNAEQDARREAERTAREEEKRLKAEVKRLTAAIATAQTDRDSHHKILEDTRAEVEELRKQSTPEAREKRQAELAMREAELRQQLLDHDHRDAFAAIARKHHIHDKAIKAAWDAVKAAGYRVESDKPNPLVLSKAVEALKQSADYMFQSEPKTAHEYQPGVNGTGGHWGRQSVPENTR